MNRYITEYLYKRGFDTAEKQQELLEFRPEKLRTVADMINGRKLLEKLKEAVQEGKHITVYGDYDADGIMAAVRLYSGLERLCRCAAEKTSGHFLFIYFLIKNFCFGCTRQPASS